MKRLVLLLLLLFPIFLFAQYPTFSNKQKLGVQTTGDGLIYRGDLEIPNYQPSNVNNAYFYLDTVRNTLKFYKGGWIQIYPTTSDTTSLGNFLLKSDTLAMLLPYLRKSDTISLSNRINNKLSLADTASMLAPYLKLADTTSMLAPYFRDSDTTMLNLNARFNSKLNATDTVSLSNRIDLKLNQKDTINLSNRIDLKLNKSDTISLSNRIDIKLNPSDTVSLSNRINTKLNSTDTISLSNRINKKLDTLYVNYQTNVDLLTNKDTININTLEAGAGINIVNNVISLDTTLLDSVVRVQNVYVKNGTGTVLNKGEAVYVTGANGTNIIIGRASNVAESTSSKTLGLTMTSIPVNGFGYVIKEGLLAGLNTDTATNGDPIWLGVNGGLIFGLVNKPFAPKHLVYLGIVTRKQQNNGEVYVTVQNGFEIKELHDVQIIDPVNKASLYYNSSEQLWRDTTATLLVSDTASMLNPYLRKLDTISLSNRIDKKFNTVDTAILGYVTTYSNQLNINGNKTFNNTVSVDSLNATKQAKIQSLTVGKGGSAIVGGIPGGISSTAFGFEVLKNNTIGDWNTAMGYHALLSNTIAWNNVAIGNNALKFNTTGEYNTAVGSYALDLNIVGNYNTAIGYNSGNGSRGDNNIFIGNGSGHLVDTVDNVLVIGSAAAPLLTGILSGNKKLGVNINPLNLTHTFEVNSPISNSVKITSNTNSTNLELANNSGSSVYIKSSNKNMILQTDTTALVYLNGDNKKVGILTMIPQQELEVAGNVRIDSLNNNLTPFRLIGSTNNNDLTNVNLGEGLSFLGDTLKVDLTIIDTAIAASSITLIGDVSGSGSTNSSVNTVINNGVVTNDMLAGSISDSKLNTITTAGKVSNSATTATSSNTNNAIVTRDGSGNFIANNITATLTGNASTVTSVTPSNFASQTANTVLAAPNGLNGTPSFRSLASADIPNLNYLPLTGGILTGGLTGTSSNFLNGVFGSSSGLRLNIGPQSVGFNRRISDGVIYSNSGFAYQFQHTPSTINTSDFLALQVYNPSGTQISPNSLLINGLGNVGIGVTTPGYKLDVGGTFNASGNSLIGGTLGVTGATTLSSTISATTGTFTGLTVNNSNVNGEGVLTLKSYNFNFANKIQFGDGSVIRREIIYPNSSSNMQFRSYTVGGSSGGYDFYVSNGSTESLAATISTDKSLSLTGNLGVTGATTLSDDLILRTSGGSRFKTAIRHYYEQQSRYAGEIQFLPSNSSGSALTFITNQSGFGQTERMRIDDFGRIGIGTPSPTYNLDVVGTFRATGNSLIGGTLGVTSNITANSFVKSLGNSSQFLKADGSVDANTYLTTGTAFSTYLPLTGGTLTGALNGTSQSLNSILTISDNSTIYSTIITGPSSSETVRFGLNQNISGGSSMFMGGSQSGGGNNSNPNIFFTDTQRAYASIGGIHTSGSSNNKSGHIVFNTTPNLTTVPLTERMRIAQDGSITMSGTLGVTGATTLTGALNGTTGTFNTRLGVGSIESSSITSLFTSGTGNQEVHFAHTGNTPGATVTLRLTTNLASNYNQGTYIQGIVNRGVNEFSGAIGTNGSEYIRLRGVDDGGIVGVGIFNNNPSYNLDLTGTFRATGNSLIGGTLGVSGVTTLSNLGDGASTRMVVASSTGVLSTQAIPSGGSGTVTNVSALTIGTSGTDVTSSVANPTTTPIITLNIPDANIGARGLVTSGNQVFGGSKTFNDNIFVNGVSNFASGIPGGFNVTGTLIRFSSYPAGTLSVNASGIVTSSSDSTLKVADGLIDSALVKINKLTPRYYYWKDNKTSNRQLGFFAQEVNSVLGEEAAPTPTNGNKYGIYDISIVAYLVKAVQEQQVIIDTLKSEIDKIKEDIVKLKQN